MMHPNQTLMPYGWIFKRPSPTFRLLPSPTKPRGGQVAGFRNKSRNQEAPARQEHSSRLDLIRGCPNVVIYATPLKRNKYLGRLTQQKKTSK